MKINTVIFDIGGVMVGLGRLHFFEQFGYSPQMCERLLSSTMKSPHWKELDRGVLTDEEVIDRFVKDAPELETEIRRSMENVHGIVYRLETSIPWIEELRESGRRVILATLPPINSELYLRYLCRDGLNRDNIVRWLGDVEAISRWQEKYSAMAAAAAREAGAKLLDLRAAFPRCPDRLRDYVCEDGIHPSRLGQELIYRTVAADLRTLCSDATC